MLLEKIKHVGLLALFYDLLDYISAVELSRLIMTPHLPHRQLTHFKINFQIHSPIAEAIVLSAKYLSGLELKNLRNLNDFPRAFNEL